MKKIPLTQGLVALVDDMDYAQVAAVRWYADVGPWVAYARRTITVGGRSVGERMHRFILGLRGGDQYIVDHINGDGLDNRRANLRVTTAAGNSRNRKMQRNNTSGYRGVVYSRNKDRWVAIIKVNGKRKDIGRYKTREEAANAYRIAAAELHGEFARQP